MCTFKITNYTKELPIDSYLKLGGPTLSKTINIDGVIFTHNLLSITGAITPQPILYKNNLYMLLGEIYNYDKKYPSDIYSVIYNYELYGYKFTDYLDGEFLIIVYNLEKGCIYFFTDPWSTQMVWYSTFENYFYFSTFPLNNDSFRLSSNSHYVYDTKNNTFKHKNYSLYTWDLNQYKDTYDDWDEAFKEAVSKRYHKTDNILALSGGLDSSCIALCLSDLKKPFESICLDLYNLEDTITLNSVLAYTTTYNKINYILKDDLVYNENLIYKFLYDKNLSKYSLNLICSEVKNLSKKILITGQGSDEIIDNYVEKFFYRITDNIIDISTWPEDIRPYFPYGHFYTGLQRDYIDKHSYVALSYGIELRNPFLDKKLAQEWLNISPELKNKERKGPLKNFLRMRGIPLPTKMVGLSSHNIK